MTVPPPCLVAVPIRSFRDSKTRLAAVLSAAERAHLARSLADGVVDALEPAVESARVAVAVVTDDPDVGAWATHRRLEIVVPGSPGLDGAAAAGLSHAAASGARWVAVVHADLAAPEGLDPLVRSASAPDRASLVTAVADRRADGTNVLVVPTATSFAFAYGPGSYHRHRAAAARAGLAFVGVEGDDLGWDVDTPEELDWLRSRRPG